MAKGQETNPQKEVTAVVIGQPVLDAIKVASGNLQGEALGEGGLLSAASVIATDANRRNFFDPSLSQYVENLVVFFDENSARVKEVPVGTQGNSAIVCTIPAGIYQADGTVTYNKSFNAYISTFRKSVNVADAEGEPVLLENNQPKVLDGTGNRVWEEMRGYRNEAELLKALSGRKFRCIKIKRDFAPSNYIGENDNRRPTGHRLTSLPLFEEIHD